MIAATLRCGRFELRLGRPLVMGVVNVTPDSFSDGGRFASTRGAIDHALALQEDGADILDIGGESTRPGAMPVGAGEELDRIGGVVEGLLGADVPLSVDTAKPAVMRWAVEAGVDMINDISGFRGSAALEAVAGSGAALCIMHMRGEPRTMQVAPSYADVVGEVGDFLRGRLQAAEAAGVAPARLVVDPGFGFGKTLAHNLALLRNLRGLVPPGVPVMAGLSRKSMLGRLTGREVGERVHASVAAALLAVLNGASIVRVHDVRATVDALAVYNALQESEGQA